MRFYKAWIVASKDMEEFKRTRYVLWTLIGMPIILALLPVLSLIIPLLIAPQSTSNSGMLELLSLLPAFTLPLLIMIPVHRGFDIWLYFTAKLCDNILQMLGELVPSIEVHHQNRIA